MTRNKEDKKEKKGFFRSGKFWLAVIFILSVFIFFFDRNTSFFGRREVRRDIEKLKYQKDYYQNRIREDSSIIEKLKDDEFLEQYAREHYLMKRKGDSVYVLKYPEKRDGIKNTTTTSPQ